MNSLELNWKSKIAKQTRIKSWLFELAKNTSQRVKPDYLLEVFRIRDFVKYLFRCYGVDKMFLHGKPYKDAVANVSKKFREIRTIDIGIYETDIFECYKYCVNNKPVMKVKIVEKLPFNVLKVYRNFINTKNLDIFSISKIGNTPSVWQEFNNWYKGKEFKEWITSNTWQPVHKDYIDVKFSPEIPNTIINKNECYCVKSLKDELPLLKQILGLYNTRIQCSIKPLENYPTSIITDKGIINIRYSQVDSISKWMQSCGISTDAFMINDSYVTAIPVFPYKYMDYNESHNPFISQSLSYAVGINVDWIASIKLVFKNKRITITQHNEGQTTSIWKESLLL